MFYLHKAASVAKTASGGRANSVLSTCCSCPRCSCCASCSSCCSCCCARPQTCPFFGCPHFLHRYTFLLWSDGIVTSRGPRKRLCGAVSFHVIGVSWLRHMYLYFPCVPPPSVFTCSASPQTGHGGLCFVISPKKKKL